MTARAAASSVALLRRLGVRYVALHAGLYSSTGRAWFAWQGLVDHGYGDLARDGVVTMFAPGQPRGQRPRLVVAWVAGADQLAPKVCAKLALSGLLFLGLAMARSGDRDGAVRESYVHYAPS